jgi:hypothetical protein
LTEPNLYRLHNDLNRYFFQAKQWKLLIVFFP